PFGGNVVGLEAASWRYFNKSPQRLTWAEASMMAVLPNAPSITHVNKNRPRLLAKRDRLLQKLLEKGSIDQLDYEAALLEPLPSTLYALPNEAPHYLELLRKEEDGRIYTSHIEPTIQNQSAQVLNDFYPFWKAKKIYNAGALILETKTGNVVAYHGNIPITSEETWVDMVQAPRSSGSILKPLLYAHQIDEGLISPVQLAIDIPTYISGFNPTNYHKSFSGAIPIDEALQQSLNVPAVRQLQQYGVSKFLTRLRKHGLTTLNNSSDHYGLSLILGGGEVTLWDLANVYQRLGAQLVEDRDDDLLTTAAIFQTFEALKGLARPDESGNWQVMDSRFPVAWKTGTSYGHRDAWAIGVTPSYTIATWVGNADGEGRDGIVGVGTAGKLLFTLFDIMPQEDNWFSAPYEDMSYFTICKESGYLTSVICPDTIQLLLPNQVERTKVCPYHYIHYTNEDETVRVDPSCVEHHELKQTTYFQLPPEISTYYIPSHPEYKRLPPYATNCATDSSVPEMTFTYPLDGETIYLPKDLNNTDQQLIARIAHQQTETRLFWYLDDTYLGTTELFHSMSIRPSPGQHTLLVEDVKGNRTSRQFNVANRLHP
ncbi:MAG: penicillin-binding protein 1C, partial [Saprospiraceae bacterium]|nr:penicillin-binding protein 1C [Saprospiraceae bacterium]